MKKKSALALIIGNAAYNGDYKLNNSVNDANAISEKLLQLGFVIKPRTDCTIESFEQSVNEFGSDLKSYDIGLFYFSGHGMQIKGVNYLTATDTNFFDEPSVKRTAYSLDEVIDFMQQAKTDINIIILDACRDNPLADRFRSISSEGLAPIYAPKGTIIAFSTSPGQKAKDYGAGKNSIYTGSLLNHINDPHIPIEEFFKRVRTSVYDASGGTQTSWEHTSLIGTFCFNSGELIHSPDLPYTLDTVADKDFQSSGSDIDEVIKLLRTHDWYKQKNGLDELKSITPSTIERSKKFLLGRNILQSATGGERAAMRIVDHLDTWIEKYNDGDENHVMNGILYELYFDSNGLFRREKLKSKLLEEVLSYQTNAKFHSSFEFIEGQLAPFSNYLFFIPGLSPKACAIEIKGEQETYFNTKREEKPAIKVLSIKHENVDIMTQRKSEDDADNWGDIMLRKNEFVDRVSKSLGVPKEFLRISCNLNFDDYKILFLPDNFEVGTQ